jgi:hypothetical protein
MKSNTIPHLILSDHDPVSISIKLTSSTGTTSSHTRRSYFKANINILKKKGNLEILKKAWQTPIKSAHPHVRFHVAKARFRSKFIELQRNHSRASEQSIALQHELDQSKHSIQVSAQPQEIQILKTTTALLRDIEYASAIKNLKYSKQKNYALGD